MGSLKLALFNLLILAAASVLGTLLPQGASQEDLQAHYSRAAAGLIELLGLQDLYHTNWFRFLLVLLGVSLIVCTIQRLPKTLRLLRHREESPTRAKLLKFSHSKEITTVLPIDEAQAHLTRIIAREFAPVRSLESTAGYAGIAEKGRWSRLMVYVVHLSVLMILLGALLGSVFGFKGTMNIPEGASSDEVALSSGHQSMTLPFKVRCDDFDVSYYDTGAPKEFRSDLVLLEEGKEPVQRAIRVNEPLSYRGISFYQASYGSTVKQAEVDLTNQDSGKTTRLTLPLGEPMTIPDANDVIELVNYQQNLSGLGAAVGISLKKGEETQPFGSWILVDQPEFHGNRIKNYRIKPTGVDTVQYTGIQVKRDPGIWMIYVGFITLVVSMGLSFYTSHRKLWVLAYPDRNRTRIIIAGRNNKSSVELERKLDGLYARLHEALNSDEHTKKARA